DPLGSSILYYQINNCLSIEELRLLTTELLTQEIAYWKQKKEGRDSEPVRIAKQYVQEHLDRQISLEEVAARAYVSAGYLGILFKQKTGSNFSDYVIEARMEKAKVLLRDTKLTIAEVANQVGYADARHFSKVFNKVYKIKPTMYRKFYS
ncbi:MAG: helix-turn-helix domain-containing protein, partial [Butyricicoccus sp.]